MNKQKNKAFTIVELIVVITILAILGAIAFISMQGYSLKTRDTVRVADISIIGESLKLFQLKSSKYPEPDSGNIITYSGVEVWTQGVFGDTTFINVVSLGNKPIDPLSGKEYTYSVLNDRQEYQLSGIYEGDTLSFNNGINNNSYAAKEEKYAIVRGDFNGSIAHITFGALSNILALPSITTSSTGFTLENIYLNNLFVYNGFKNLPSDYLNSLYDINGDLGVNFVNNSDHLVFSGSIKDLKGGNGIKRFDLINSLKKAFSGTVSSENKSVKEIVSINLSDSKYIDVFGINFVKNNLGGGIIETIKSPWKKVDINCDKNDIIIGTQTWAGCNSTVGLGIEYLVDEGCKDYTGSGTTGCNRPSNEKENIYNAIYGVNNIWGKLYSWDDSGSACPIGWKVPSESDFAGLEITLNGSDCRTNLDSWKCGGLGWEDHTLKNSNNNIIEAFELALSGIYTTGVTTFSSRGEEAYLWSTTDDITDSTLAYIRMLGYYSPSVSRIGLDRANYISVRCIKSD